MPKIFAMIAILSSALYSGAALYLALVEHPARMACAIKVSFLQWVQSVQRTPRYGALALIGASAGLILGRLSLTSAWTWGSLTLLGVLPLTVIAILPLQRQIQAADPESDPIEVRSMLHHWGWLHGLRVGLGLVSMVVFLHTAIR